MSGVDAIVGFIVTVIVISTLLGVLVLVLEVVGELLKRRKNKPEYPNVVIESLVNYADKFRITLNVSEGRSRVFGAQNLRKARYDAKKLLRRAKADAAHAEMKPVIIR